MKNLEIQILIKSKSQIFHHQIITPVLYRDFLSVLMIKYGMRGGDLWEEVAAREPEVEWGQLEGQL